ncbi:MAG: pyridoxal phosphate-dependent aminotransferase [Candidatus Omnitrophica bacterium]|nr:pyridoxal phosphate-dependent aminotransferase [Candidatus Omnitrophota bacterium]
MLASRTNWKFTHNQLTQRLETLKQSGVQVIDLSESNPTHCGFDYLKSSLLTPLADPQNIIYEPNPRGMPEARYAIQTYYQEKKVTVPLEHIFLTASTSEAYSLLMRLLVNPGQRILVPRPSYPLFDFLTDLNDVILDSYFLRYEAREWHIDMTSLTRAIHSDTKAIILVNPNNPTGSFLKRNELNEILKLARKHSLALISDEVFSDYSFSEDSDRVLTLAGATHEMITFTLGGISKMLGLPQMKLSWILAGGPTETLRFLLERLEVILDTYLSVNTPAQRALVSWLPLKHSIQGEIKDRVQKNLALLIALLSQTHPASCLPMEGGWYAVLRLPKIQSEEEWALEFLEKDHVYLHPGYFFDFEEEVYIVISLLPPCNIFKEGISRILTRVKNK